MLDVGQERIYHLSIRSWPSIILFLIGHVQRVVQRPTTEGYDLLCFLIHDDVEPTDRRIQPLFEHVPVSRGEFRGVLDAGVQYVEKLGVVEIVEKCDKSIQVSLLRLAGKVAFRPIIGSHFVGHLRDVRNVDIVDGLAWPPDSRLICNLFL